MEAEPFDKSSLCRGRQVLAAIFSQHPSAIRPDWIGITVELGAESYRRHDLLYRSRRFPGFEQLQEMVGECRIIKRPPIESRVKASECPFVLVLGARRDARSCAHKAPMTAFPAYAESLARSQGTIWELLMLKLFKLWPWRKGQRPRS